MYQQPGIRVSQRDLKSSRCEMGSFCERYVAKSSGSANYKEVHCTGHLALILTHDMARFYVAKFKAISADLIVPMLDTATTSYRK